MKNNKLIFADEDNEMIEHENGSDDDDEDDDDENDVIFWFVISMN